MRTTVVLDDDLVRIAQEFTGVAEKTALLREALKALIERESARRLASLGGTMPHLKNIPRRRPTDPRKGIGAGTVRATRVRSKA
jgi:Arc/MetJ family transcription regulator